MTTPAAADLLAKFEIIRELGHGGMGVVFEARHKLLEQRVAIKVLKSEPSEADLERFRREARIAAQLRSIHAARVIDIDTTAAGLPFMVMELLEGNDLSHEIAAGPLPISTAVDYVRQAADALGEAHSLGVVHRDVKPANLFLCKLAEDASRRIVKVLDFGIAKTADASRLTGGSETFGTPSYMSPEQVRATAHVDQRADIWALGMVLYECLTGGVPWSGSPVQVITAISTDAIAPPSRARPDIPRELEAVIMKALEKDPEKRLGSAHELREALAPWAATGKLQEPPRSNSLTGLVAPLGTLLIQEGVITSEQLAAALELQRREPHKKLGELLVEVGACTPGQIDVALEKQRDAEARARSPFRRGLFRRFSLRANGDAARRSSGSALARAAELLGGVVSAPRAPRLPRSLVVPDDVEMREVDEAGAPEEPIRDGGEPERIDADREAPEGAAADAAETPADREVPAAGSSRPRVDAPRPPPPTARRAKHPYAAVAVGVVVLVCVLLALRALGATAASLPTSTAAPPSSPGAVTARPAAKPAYPSLERAP